MKPGDKVSVYDRFRFAIPLKGTVAELSEHNDVVMVVLDETNNHNYPIGCSVWVHQQQCLGEYTPAPKEQQAPQPTPPLSLWRRILAALDRG